MIHIVLSADLPSYLQYLHEYVFSNLINLYMYFWIVRHLPCRILVHFVAIIAKYASQLENELCCIKHC